MTADAASTYALEHIETRPIRTVVADLEAEEKREGLRRKLPLRGIRLTGPGTDPLSADSVT